MVQMLTKYPKMTFIWAEISFLSLWWMDQTETVKDQFRKLLASGKLEIVTGGYVMHDEANTHYASILEQLFYGE